MVFHPSQTGYDTRAKLPLFQGKRFAALGSGIQQTGVYFDEMRAKMIRRLIED
jgi:hypothetical protein